MTLPEREKAIAEVAATCQAEACGRPRRRRFLAAVFAVEAAIDRGDRPTQRGKLALHLGHDPGRPKGCVIPTSIYRNVGRFYAEIGGLRRCAMASSAYSIRCRCFT